MPRLGSRVPQDGPHVARKHVARKVEAAAARPRRKPHCCRPLVPACGRYPGGTRATFPDETLPAKEPTNGSGYLGDGAMSGDLGSLKPNVAAGVERDLQARSEKQPRPL